MIAHYPKENVGDKDIHYEMPTFASVTCERQGPDRVRPKIIAHYPTERQDDRARHYEMPTVAEDVTEDDIKQFELIRQENWNPELATVTRP